MKHLVFAFALLACAGEGALAQHSIRGVVKDSRSKDGLEFMNVALQTMDSALVGGAVSGADGRFVLADVEPGNYRLMVSGVGYLKQFIPLNGVKADISLPDIFLEEDAVALANVTVNASNQSSRIDKKLVYPSERQVKASTNGMDLLLQLMLPKISVNPVEMTATLFNGAELQYRINGVKVEAQDITALLPADIIRIEYHDNPGLRYGNAEVVLDYIVHRPETGGSMGVNAQAGLTAGFVNDNMNVRINHKKSEFSANYWLQYRNFYSMWRDNEEDFTFADGSVLRRKEVGEPGHLRYTRQSLNMAYSYQNDKRMLNTALRFYSNEFPNFDYRGTLYNLADPEDRVRMIDNNFSSQLRPAIDLYYQENLAHGQTLVLNWVGTYNYTNNRRFYEESREEAVLTQVDNGVTGKKYSWIGEGIYEKAFGNNRLSAGIRHTQAYTDNIYSSGSSTEMVQAETFLYSEFKGKAQKLDYTLGVGATRSYLGQAGTSEGYSNYTFNPRIVFQYSLPGSSSIRLRSEISNLSPSLSDLSAIDQEVDSLQVQRGNPNLKPYLRYRSELTYDIQKGIFYANLLGQLEYRPDAIMDEKFIEGDKIIQTWNNQKNAQMWVAIATLRVGPVKDILQFSLRGGVRHFICNGYNYRHVYTNWFANPELSATYKHVTTAIGIETSQNSFLGETMNGGENIHYLMLGYKYKSASLTLMMLNPFVDNYKQETENWSQYASFRRAMYINDTSRFVALRFTWNFSFGQKFNAAQRKLNNADEESGVMSSGK
jgi:hypothetical protein